ncbi:MAG: Trk system potassium transporter TrkA [Alphaproteobacteria bacterium]|jgi:trk system potassium uptake protein TrkA
MRIVICGAGIVGSAIATHLAAEQNDVTVIDHDEEKVQRIAEHADLSAIVGLASHPDVLERAGLEQAELIIAVTESDEVNMVACQMAHSLFKTRTKIARIRSNAYLRSDIKSKFFTTDNMPIDFIISPEQEVASAVSRQLRLPGAFDVKELGGGKLQLVGVLCDSNCPIINTPLRHLTDLFPDLSITIVAILRENLVTISRDGTDELKTGDRVYFVCDTGHLERAMAAFGHHEHRTSSVVIAGGGNIGQLLAQEIESGYSEIKSKIIELHKDQARNIAAKLSNTSVICGDVLNADILKEASVGSSETFVAVSNDDEVNILSALLAKRIGAKYAVVLVNMQGFLPLISTLGVDAVINPPQITVSSVLEHIRRGRIIDVHSIVEGLGEVLEAEAVSGSDLVGLPLRKSRIPKGVTVGAVLRGEQIIPARGDTIIEAGDHVIVFAKQGKSRQAENILSAK